MLQSRRATLAWGLIGMMGLATGSHGGRKAEHIIAKLARQSELGNAALLRGDVDTYLRFIKLADDFTLMSPFGGTPSKGSYTREEWEEIGRFFRNGTLRQELVRGYTSPDMVVLVVIEHCRGEVGGLAAQDWSLRVTLVYRREADEWFLVHRHADPLAHGITIEQSAALARGTK
jgi:ketosteroid isomerase-like protein